MEVLKKVEKLKKELDALRPIGKEEEDKVMQKFRLDWNYHSNHLEGNSLTYGETKALILFGITAQGKPLEDHVEMSGHNEAIEWVIDIVKEERPPQRRPLTENFIRELHTLLVRKPYEVDAITPEGKPTKKRVEAVRRAVGKYKTTPNHVRTNTGEIFRFATPEETPAKMHDLLQWYKDKKEDKTSNPILLAAEFHYKFIRIHPFDDGNGRVTRILMNLILMQDGYPPVIIKTEDKENYFAVLRKADVGMIEPFIEYIAKNLARSLELMIKGAKGESIEEPDNLDKEIALLEQKVKSAGNKIEVTKSKEAIPEIYDETIARLADVFISKCEKFDKFYLKIQFQLFVNNRTSGHSKNEAFKASRDRIDKNTSIVKLNYQYNTFNRAGFQEFSHNSSVEFHFLETRYRVNNIQSSLSFEKFYNEQLNEEEINALVKTEMKAHQEMIENRIKELKKNKK